MFLDATVILSILRGEDGFSDLITKIEQSRRRPITGPHVRCSVVKALTNQLASSSPEDATKADGLFESCLRLLNCSEVMLTTRAAKLAALAGANRGLELEDALTTGIAIANKCPILSLNSDLNQLLA